MRVDVDISKVNATLKRGKALHKNARNFLGKVGRMEVDMARERIRITKEDPDGRSWDRWRPATRKARTKKGTASRGLLMDSGFLYNNFTSRASNKRVTITNRAPYASYLQNGTSRMVARPFMGWGKKSTSVIENIYRKYIKRWK